MNKNIKVMLAVATLGLVSFAQVGWALTATPLPSGQPKGTAPAPQPSAAASTAKAPAPAPMPAPAPAPMPVQK